MPRQRQAIRATRLTHSFGKAMQASSQARLHRPRLVEIALAVHTRAACQDQAQRAEADRKTSVDTSPGGNVPPDEERRLRPRTPYFFFLAVAFFVAFFASATGAFFVGFLAAFFEPKTFSQF
jgi:hypothetical protein